MNIVNQIAQDLALRLPQKAALKVLDAVLSDIPDLRVSLPEIEAEVAGRGGFERFDTEFPSFGFHIATAVGKTRLMGATIAYLHKTHGYRNFFILTKGSTVYRKTIDNFSRGHGKYALEGYTEMPPFELITGEDYERSTVADHLRAMPYSDILTEQTIGRGMRLPFGAQTSDEELDTLEIAAHDHFAAIVRDVLSSAIKHGTPIRTKEIKDQDKAETEKRTIEPLTDSPYLIEIPKLTATYRTEGRLQDFDITPRRDFSPITQTLVGTVLGATTQRTFDVPAYEMQEDAFRYVNRTVFDEASGISANDAHDFAFVPRLVRRYLEKIKQDETLWKPIVQSLLSASPHETDRLFRTRSKSLWRGQAFPERLFIIQRFSRNKHRRAVSKVSKPKSSDLDF